MYSSLRKQLSRLSVRLTLWHTQLFLVAALAVLGLTYFIIKSQLLAQEREAILFRVAQFSTAYERGGLPGVQNLAALRKGRDQKASFVRIATTQNHTLWLRDAEDWTEFSPDRLANGTPPANPVRGWITLNSQKGTELLIAFDRLADGSLIEVGSTNESELTLLEDVRHGTLLGLLIFLPASIAGGIFFASRALRPVQYLTKAAAHIVATASFEARVPSLGTGDELDALVLVFNQMLGRIEQLIRGLRDSLDNVAHDLRTPMTRLRQKAQSALESRADLPTSRDALADCIEEAERVLTLLNTLMDIAEAESGLIVFQSLPVEIASLVDCAVDSYSEVSEEKGVTVFHETPRGLYVNGDAGALRRVLANLLDNAIKYTPAGGTVRISAETSGQFIALKFTDTGDGIAEEDLPRIWDRLFRGDKSRSQRGLGLGLSFVRAIVASHGGTATVSSTPGKGTSVTILLPSAPAPEPSALLEEQLFSNAAASSPHRSGTSGLSSPRPQSWIGTKSSSD